MPRTAARSRPRPSGSAEHYLRAVLELREERGYARVVDIAARLGLTKGSVSLALAQLKERGLLRFDPARFPVPTAAGRRMALGVMGRYRIARTFLTEVLGLEPQQAAVDACSWEHVMSHAAADRILDLLRFAGEDPAAAGALRSFREYHRACGSRQTCATCATHGPVESFCSQREDEGPRGSGSH